LSSGNHDVESPFIKLDLLGSDGADCIEDDEGIGGMGLDEFRDLGSGREYSGGCVDWELAILSRREATSTKV
jgi:hypothetical protein